jgi:hypothetical protein
MALSLSRTTPHPPAAPTAEDARRWEHTGLRMRMLLGRWEDDLEHAIALHVDPSRQAAWGTPDLSSNIFRSVTKQLSVLYDRPPVVDHTDGSDAGLELIKAVDASGLWSLMPRFAANVIGCREFVMMINATPSGDLVYRPVAPNRVIALADAERPDVPVYMRELRLREHPETHDLIWTWHEIDIRDPANPVERILNTDHAGKAQRDLTVAYLGSERTGEAFPYRDSSGAPFLPAVLYHAEKTGNLWDAYEGSEVVFGSLNTAVFYSLLGHVLRDASWPQRYAIGALPMGLGLEDGRNNANRRAISTDPASILMFQAEGDLQPSLGQFQAGADVQKMHEAISSYEQRIAEFAGVSPADLQRLGGTARSGYAISISNAGRREAQRKYTPMFRAGDLELLSVSAKLLNLMTGSSVPETGYTIRYQAIPLSEQERDGLRKDLMEKVQAGIMSKVDAYMEIHSGISRARAIDALRRIQLEESIAPTPAGAGAGAGGVPPAVVGDAPEIDDEGNITAAGDRVVLNGAQVTAAQNIIESVAAQKLPRDSGLNMLIEFFGIPPAAALRIMGDVGLGFRIASPQ